MLLTDVPAPQLRVDFPTRFPLQSLLLAGDVRNGLESKAHLLFMIFFSFYEAILTQDARLSLLIRLCAIELEALNGRPERIFEDGILS